VVQFEYMDAKGDFSSRKVRVDTVGQWQFEGYCYTRHERRTFRYDGVIGCVTIHSTGEIVTPEKLERELLAL
jgi:predicted DNA-binding transcriptional regulator YafY